MKWSLLPLPYDYNALEPYIDAQTMQIHHDKHHQAYVTKLTALMDTHPELQDKELEDLMKQIATLTLSDSEKTILRNHGGGHLNHSIFWNVMNPSNAIDEALVADIKKIFGSMETFKERFTLEATNRFGSGWAWLVRKADGTLDVYSTANQDSPYLQGDTPVFGLDVWEHAYYLNYQNKRPDYINAWWKVLKLLP